MYFFFFKQKTAYDVRISDWSSDVCSSDLCQTPRYATLSQHYGARHPDHAPYNRGEHPMSAVETLIVPRSSDLGGGLQVRRALPSAQRRTVGPFVFLDRKSVV